MAGGEGHLSPGEGRIAAAYRAGRFPASDLLSTGVVLLLLAAALYCLAGQTVSALVELFHRGLLDVLRRPREIDAAMTSLSTLVRVTLPFSGLVLFVSALSTVLPALAARRRRGRTAIPLPPQKNARFSRFALRLLGAVVFISIAISIIKGLPLGGANALEALTVLGTGLCQTIAAAGGVMVLVGAGELVLMRHIVWRTLFLDTAEQRREQRAREGDPHVKREQRARPGRGAMS
jgi:flagellar biosynthesis protein FlhB